MKMKQGSIKAQPSANVIPLRGPAAVALIVAVILGPYLQQLSILTIIQILLLFLAGAMMFHDFKYWMIQSSRYSLQQKLQNIVLDDILRALFHPQQGLLAVSATACLGNFAMYALPTTPEQRVQLWQSASGDESPDVAERILKAPGGIAELLPHSVQAWLAQDNSCETCSSIRNKQNQEKQQPIIPTLENLSPVLSSQSEPESVNITLLSDFHSENEDDDSSVATSEECNSPQPKRSPSSPMELLGSILGDVMTRQLQDWLDRFPSRSLEMTSVTAAALLWAQLRYSKRARDIVWTVVHASFSMTGSAVLTGSLLAVWLRHQLHDSKPSSPVDSYFSRHSFFSLKNVRNSGQRMKSVVISLIQSERARKVQGFLAVAVLAYFGRRRIDLSRSR
ncbi:hypothetical protein FisN_14Lh077 [Fistulifera solaris]|uniref:Uncharacterized protein n=1 Tax=Fistulifera solaris TaxID=1519565 RepID=A0A1Z5J9E5_FISSO|nr:hypothetical protein FisN_14Lh077 [Fistulifera solaris]|eukprot:GAX10579.1 hypothetical protein FisN_14Lh077 [Fistulifera solaris]